MSRPKDMGTEIETAAVRWLAGHGFPAACRLALAGASDIGDIELRRDPRIIAEVKRAQRGVQLKPWLREMDVEVEHAGAQFGILIMKQRGCGTGRAGRFVTAMRYPQWRQLSDRHLANGGRHSIGHWSPMKINSEYLPMIAGPGARHMGETWAWAPFAHVTPVGEIGCEGGCGANCGASCRTVVLGPLEQHVALMLESGLGEARGS